MGASIIDDDWPGPYVDGAWLTGERKRVAIENPATREHFDRVAFGTAEDVDAAYQAITRVPDEWRDSPQERFRVLGQVIEIIQDHAPEIHRLIATESGGSIHKARMEVGKSLGQIEHARELLMRCANTETPSEVPNKRNIVTREPAGRVGVITPWNVPFKLAIQSVAPALALGNGVVLKPAPDTPISGGLVLAKLFEAAGAPPGIFNVVPGYGEGVGERVVDHPDVDVISFTGSTAVGRQIGETAISDFKDVMLELGGNNPHIVTADADLKTAVDAAVFATYSNQGQACISINRHLVHESHYDKYVDRLTERAEGLRVGDPLDESTHLGPVINEDQRDRIMGLIEATIEQGARLETGGSCDGLFIEPTVISEITNEMPLACNEHFGPVAPIIRFTYDEEAIRIANDTEYGLSASVHARDVGRARRIADELETGMVHINDQPVNSEPNAPFGGVKASGLGRHNGQWAIEKYTTVRWISVQDEPRDYPL